MVEADLQAAVEEYLQAFDERDLPTCVGFYAEDATIHFHVGVFQGIQAIEEWHRERFDADLRLLQLEKITVEENTVNVDAVATSSRLKAWKINRLAGKVVLAFEEGKIKEARFSARVYNPFERW